MRDRAERERERGGRGEEKGEIEKVRPTDRVERGSENEGKSRVDG